MVLHHVTNDSKLVKISTATLGTEWFLESDGDAGNMVPVPCGSEDHVTKPQTDEVLDHLFAKIVINPVELILSEQFLKMIAEVGRAGRVLAKGLLNNNSCPATGGHTGGLQH